MRNKKIDFEAPFSLFFLFFSIAVYTPFLILYLNGEQNPYFITELITPTIFCLSAFPLSLCITKLNARGSKVFHIICGASAFYVLLSVNVYPLRLDSTKELAIISILGHLFLGIVCLLIFLKYYATGKKILYAIGIFSLVCSGYIIIELPPVQKKDYSEMLQVGKSNNIIVIVMDMFQGYFVSNFLDKKPELLADFSGFLYFKNAVSAAPYTSVSTRYILTGKPPRQETGSTAIIDQNDNIFSDAIKNGYDATYVSGAVPVTLPKLQVFDANKNLIKDISYLQFAYTCSKRYYPDMLLPDIFTPLEFGWMSKTNARDSFLWFFQNLLCNDNKEKTFHYYHNLMTHQPIRFDSLGNYSKERSPDDLYGEIEFAFSTLKSFINRLKKMGKYEETTIIITGDHGYNILNEFSDTVLPLEAHYLRDPVAEKQKGQYDVALMIKPEHSSGPMHFTNGAVVLTDLRKTLNEIMAPGTGKNLRGVNILQEDLPIERTVDILSYAGKEFTNKDFNRFDNWKPMKIRIPISGRY